MYPLKTFLNFHLCYQIGIVSFAVHSFFVLSRETKRNMHGHLDTVLIHYKTGLFCCENSVIRQVFLASKTVSKDLDPSCN